MKIRMTREEYSPTWLASTAIRASQKDYTHITDLNAIHVAIIPRLSNVVTEPFCTEFIVFLS